MDNNYMLDSLLITRVRWHASDSALGNLLPSSNLRGNARFEAAFVVGLRAEWYYMYIYPTRRLEKPLADKWLRSTCNYYVGTGLLNLSIHVHAAYLYLGN